MSEEIIVLASQGDPDAVHAVLQHYARYIRTLASRLGYVDVEAQCCMEAKLVQALLKFDPNYNK